MINNLAINRINGLFAKTATLVSDSVNLLKKAVRPLWKVLTFSLADDLALPEKGLCLTLEKGGLSAAGGTHFLSRTRIKGFRRYPIEDPRIPSPEELASSAVIARDQLGAEKAAITLSLPKSWVVIRTAELPTVVKNNLSEVVSYELDRLTPFDPASAYFDFKVLGEENGHLKLLIVATRADLVNPYLEALKANHLAVDRITTDLSGLGALGYHLDKGPCLLVKVDSEGYEGALFLGGVIAGVANSSWNPGNLKDPVDTLVREIDRLKSLIPPEKGQPQVVLDFKGLAGHPALKDTLRLKLNLPIRVLGEADFRLNTPSQSREVPYAAVGGLLESFQSKDKRLNLLAKGVGRIPRPSLWLSTLLIIALAGLVGSYVVIPVGTEKERLAQIEQLISQRKGEVKKVEDLKKEIGDLDREVLLIRDFKVQPAMSLEILKELTVVLPKGAWLTRARIAGPQVSLEGYAPSATELVPSLERSKSFKKVEFASPTFRDPRQNMDRFQIKMETEGFQDEN